MLLHFVNLAATGKNLLHLTHFKLTTT